MTRARWLSPLLALLLAGAVFLPPLANLSSRFLGIEYVDHYGTQWFYWFVEHQIRSGRGMGHTDLYFYPWGKDIFLHTGTNVLDGYLALPFRVLLGPVLGYNVFVLAGIALTGVAFSLLAREFTDDRGVVLLSSVLFALSPFAMFELVEGRPTQAILVLPVLFVLAVLRTGARRGLLWPILAGALLAACGYQYWFYAFFGGVICLAHGLVRVASPPPEAGSRWRVLGRHAVVAGVALLLSAPVAVPLALLASQQGEVPGLLDVGRWSLRASPPITVEDQTIGLFLWQPLRRYSGFYVVEMGPQERLLAQAILVPWVSFAVAAFALWRPGRLPRGPLLAMGLASAVIAMGPFMLVGPWALPNPIYIGLIKSVGFLQRLWWPARAVVYLSVVLGVGNVALLAWAAQRGGWARVAIPVALCLAWAGELFVADELPFPSWDASIPAGYRCLARGPAGAIMELPYAWTQAHLYYQSAHARPIMGGMLENNPVFTPAEFTALKEQNTFVKGLFAAAKMEEGVPLWSPEDASAVHDLGYRYVVEQKDAFFQSGHAPGMLDNVLRLRKRNLRRLLEQRIGAPVYDDARVAIYAPWGDPAPCQRGDVEPDVQPVGLTEVSADARVLRTPDEQLFHRLFIDATAYELMDEDGLGAPAEGGAPVAGAEAPEGAPPPGTPPPPAGAAGAGRAPLPPALPPPLDRAPRRAGH